MYTESQVKKLQTFTLKLNNIEKSADPNASLQQTWKRGYAIMSASYWPTHFQTLFTYRLPNLLFHHDEQYISLISSEMFYVVLVIRQNSTF